MSEAELLAAQAWRTETPGHEGWARTVRPDDANKYYVISRRLSCDRAQGLDDRLRGG